MLVVWLLQGENVPFFCVCVREVVVRLLDCMFDLKRDVLYWKIPASCGGKELEKGVNIALEKFF